MEEVDPIGPRAYHGTAVVGFNIYVIGGFDGADYFNSCRCFNAVTKVWREVAPMNARRLKKIQIISISYFFSFKYPSSYLNIYRKY